MGQRVNPILYRSGVSSYWGSINYPFNKNLSSLIETNYLFDLVKDYFRAKGMKLYNQKCKLKDNSLHLNIYFYENKRIPERFVHKRFKFLSPKLDTPKSSSLKFLNFKFFSRYKYTKYTNPFLKKTSGPNTKNGNFVLKRNTKFRFPFKRSKLKVIKNLIKDTKKLTVNLKKRSFAKNKQFKSFKIAKNFVRLFGYKGSKKLKRKKNIRTKIIQSSNVKK